MSIAVSGLQRVFMSHISLRPAPLLDVIPGETLNIQAQHTDRKTMLPRLKQRIMRAGEGRAVC